MAKTVFEPARTVEKKLIEMDSQQLCEFASKLCEYVETEVGSKNCRGGIFPQNISLTDKGELALGPAAQGDWQGRELDFLAPELYWRGKPTAACDVYSIGLLLYYSLSGGKLPLEDECEDAQLRRMAGDDFKAPKGTGRRLSEIVEKAISFKASQRYQSLGEMKAALDSCIKNLYLNGEPSAEAIFKKSDDELSEVERMMVGIMEKDDEVIPEEEGDDVKLFSPSTPIADAKAAARAREQSKQIARKLKEMSNPAVPKLKEELNPELVPIRPERHTNTIPPVQYTRDMERERKIAEDAKKRHRRPLAVILGLCVALIIIAIIFNAMLKDFQEAREKEAAQATPTVDPLFEDPVAENASDPYELFNRDEEGNIIPIESKRPDALEIESLDVSEAAREHSYELVIEDISWTHAAAKCIEMGGHLVTIGDQAEFDAVVALAEEKGVSRIWIGAHRVDGQMVWENSELQGFEHWGKGEPSYVDLNDQVAEDYVMLWNHNGWAYNDNRNDPIADYPHMYSGTVAFICEYEAS